MVASRHISMRGEARNIARPRQSFEQDLICERQLQGAITYIYDMTRRIGAGVVSERSRRRL